MRHLFQIICFTAFFQAASADSHDLKYRLTFKGNFSEAEFPVNNSSFFPSNPHFSPLVAATHNHLYSMFSIGGKATVGVKTVAETGNTRHLWRELTAHHKLGEILDMKRQSHSFFGTAEASVTVTASKSHSKFSLISMVAPSPDWVVGVNGLSLRLQTGGFVKKMVIPLYAVDVGTDSGGEFTSPNNPTDPPEAIHRLKYITNDTGVVDIEKYPFGYLTIERIGE